MTCMTRLAFPCMAQPPKFLTPPQAAERLTAAGMPVHKDTVQRWCREGGIPATITPGGRYRIRVEDVDACLVTAPVDTGAGA